jgi:hypothetical protein
VQRGRLPALAVVLLLALGVRVAFLAAAAADVTERRPELAWRDLTMLYDGRFYLLVARSFPYAYQRDARDPVRVDYRHLTVYMPLLPAAIAAADALAGDLRGSAVAVSLLTACIAVAGFARLARRFVARPLLAAALFAVLPPIWILLSTLPFSDAALLAAAILAFVAFAEDRHVLAAIAAGAAAIAQKSGFLVAVALVVALLRNEGWRGARRLPVYALAALPPLALQLHLAKVFGDPLVNVQATLEVYGAAPLAFPFSMLLEGLFRFPALDGGDPWMNRSAVAATLAFYAGALVASRGDADPKTSTLRIWLALVLGFNAFLGGSWAYYNFPRLMTLAAPAALLLWLRRYESRITRPIAATLVAASIAFSFWYGLASVEMSVRVLEQTGVVDGLVDLRESFF